MNLILEKDTPQKGTLLPFLSDASKILANIHYLISLEGRSNIGPSLSKTARETAFRSQIDIFLFGKEFGEKYKNARWVEKQSLDLKATLPTNKKEATSYEMKQQTLSHPLNRKGPSHVSRDMGQRGHYPREGRYHRERFPKTQRKTNREQR
ncbi:hypothetical protein JTB14_031025 [Gonioctena quinquepunctata]|nr:hypothetical protein JTB14_031025 [Gonioctena quinquepunctata]